MTVTPEFLGERRSIVPGRTGLWNANPALKCGASFIRFLVDEASPRASLFFGIAALMHVCAWGHHACIREVTLRVGVKVRLSDQFAKFGRQIGRCEKGVLTK